MQADTGSGFGTSIGHGPSSSVFIAALASGQCDDLSPVDKIIITQCDNLSLLGELSMREAMDYL